MLEGIENVTEWSTESFTVPRGVFKTQSRRPRFLPVNGWERPLGARFGSVRLWLACHIYVWKKQHTHSILISYLCGIMCKARKAHDTTLFLFLPKQKHFLTLLLQENRALLSIWNWIVVEGRGVRPIAVHLFTHQFTQILSCDTLVKWKNMPHLNLLADNRQL